MRLNVKENGLLLRAATTENEPGPHDLSRIAAEDNRIVKRGLRIGDIGFWIEMDFLPVSDIKHIERLLLKANSRKFYSIDRSVSNSHKPGGFIVRSLAPKIRSVRHLNGYTPKRQLIYNLNSKLLYSPRGFFMLIDGVWAIEVLGYLGWERTGVTFLDAGLIRGGSADMHHHGEYVVDGKNVKMTIHITAHGKRAQVYGEKRKNFTIRMKGKWDGDQIEGKATLVGARSDDVAYKFRLVKLE